MNASLLMSLCLIWSSTAVYAETEISSSQKFSPARAEEALQQLNHFVESNLAHSSGAIHVNAIRNRPSLESEARNGEYLSETVGQCMELALLEHDRPAFEKQLKLAMEKFAGPSGLLAWKVSEDFSKKANSSATIDDWRVAWACKLAYDQWGIQAANDFGLKIATVLANAILETGLMPQALDLQSGRGERGRLPLCYLHLPGMKVWSDSLTSLRDAQKKATFLVALGKRGHGLLIENWDPTSKGYIEGKSDDVLALIAFLNLQAVDPKSPVIQQAISRRVAGLHEKTFLPQAYDTISDMSEQEPAGATVYALLARLLIRAGDQGNAELALEHMLSFQSHSKQFYGAIGEEPVFSFDQLEAMLALREYLNARRNKENKEIHHKEHKEYQGERSL